MVQRFRLSVWAILLVACVTWDAPLRAEGLVFPPGSHIGLAPPAGLGISPGFTGFMDRESITSIVITAMPSEAFDEMVGGLTAEGFAAKGMTLIGPCDNVTTVVESRCYRATQEAGGYAFQKWLLLVRFDGETGLIVASLPDAVIADGRYSVAAMEAALSSVAYREDVVVDPVDALPFTIEEGDLLPFQRALAGSTALYAAAADGPGPRPFWIVAASLSNAPEAREVDFARMAFGQIASVSEVQVTDERPIALNQLAGHILEGVGKDSETGSDLFIFQAVLANQDGRYYRLLGLVALADKALYGPEFLRLTHTLQPRD